MTLFNHITLPLPQWHPNPLPLTFQILLAMLENREELLRNSQSIYRLSEEMRKPGPSFSNQHQQQQNNNQDNSRNSFWHVYSSQFMNSLKFTMHFELDNNDWKGDFCDRLKAGWNDNNQSSFSQQQRSFAPMGAIVKVRLDAQPNQCKWFAVMQQLQNPEGWLFFCVDEDLIELRWEESDESLKQALAKHQFFPFQFEVYGLELKKTSQELSRLIDDDGHSSSSSSISLSGSSFHGEQQSGGIPNSFRPTLQRVVSRSSAQSSRKSVDSGRFNTVPRGRPELPSQLYSKDEQSWIQPSPSKLQHKDTSSGASSHHNSSSQLSRTGSWKHSRSSSVNSPASDRSSSVSHSNGTHWNQGESVKTLSSASFNESHTSRNTASASNLSPRQEQRYMDSSTNGSPPKQSLKEELDRLRKRIASLESEKRQMQQELFHKDRMLTQITRIMSGYTPPPEGISFSNTSSRK